MSDATDGPNDPAEVDTEREDVERPSEADAQPDEIVVPEGGEMPGANEEAPTEVDAEPNPDEAPDERP